MALHLKRPTGENNYEACVLPLSIGGFTKLRSLHISELPFNTLPDSIGNLPVLERFYMGGGVGGSMMVKDVFKTQALPPTIGNWKTLKSFRIVHLPLRSLPDSVGNWTNMEEFILDHTLVSSLPMSVKNWGR